MRGGRALPPAAGRPWTREPPGSWETMRAAPASPAERRPQCGRCRLRGRFPAAPAGCERRSTAPGVAPPSRKPPGGCGFARRPGPRNSVVAAALRNRRSVSEGAVLPHASGRLCWGSLVAAKPSALVLHRGRRGWREAELELTSP